MKAREYLVSQGLAKAGRGKFSNAAKEQLNSAIESGMVFSDYDGGTVRPKEYAYETPPMSRPDMKARFENGLKISMASACNDCGYSLSWCECLSPKVNMKVVIISPM